MKSIITHPRFFLPLLLLIATAGLFAAIESKSEKDISKLSGLLEDKTYWFVREMRKTAKDLRDKTEILNDEKDLAVNLGYLEENASKLKKLASELKEYTTNPAKEIPSAKHDIITSSNIFSEIDKLNRIFTAPANIDEVKKTIADVQEEVHNLGNSLRKAQEAYLEKLSETIKRNQLEKSILLFLLTPCGLLMLAFLVCNARCHRRHEEQTETAGYYSALFAEALQSAKVGIMIRDMRTSGQPVVFVNKAFAQITGYDQVLMGRQKTDVLFGWHTDKSTIENFRNTVARGESGTFDLFIYRKDGSAFWSEWHISPVWDSKGNLSHYVNVITDITDIKQSQEALLLAKEQAERASAIKSNFLAVMSHELRTPLNGLLGVLQLLKDSPLNEDQKNLFDVAINSGYSLNEIINDILDYAKIDAGKINIVSEPFSFRGLLQDCVDLTRPVAESKNLDLRLEMEESLPGRAIGDAGRIRQILLNLITNAIKYTEKGFIKVKAQQLLTQSSADKFNALVRFEIIDTGIGISTQDQDSLFEEFSRIDNVYSRRYSGTGLGLAICKRLVKLMNGEIGVESKLGQGSKFWFMLPLQIEAVVNSKEEKQLETKSENKIQHEKTPNILLVEDSATNRLVASRFLEKAGYKYDIAVTGAEAISIAKARAYDIILMDISMPGMDGMEATRKIRELGGWAAKVPVIALTAHVMPGDREKFLAAGMNDHISKPVDYDIMVRTIESWLSTAFGGKKESANSEEQKTISKENVKEIDTSVLDRLSEILGKESMLRITRVYLEELPKRLAALKAAEEKNDIEEISHAAHTLKSSSANCGLMLFSELMAGIEMAADRGDLERLETLLPQVDNAASRARELLEKACEEKNNT